MGRKNIAVIGTHVDYFVDMYDDKMGKDPSVVRCCASAEDAATSYFRSVFENSNAVVRNAIIGVWLTTQGSENAFIFDATAILKPYKIGGGAGQEFDVVLDVRQRP